MKTKILNLAKRFITIPSVTHDGIYAHKILNLAKKELKDFTIEKFDHPTAPSLLIYPAVNRPKKFKILLNAHLDVVSANEEQFIPLVKNGTLYGRGAYDMKAAAAIMVLVFKEIAKKVPFEIGLQLVTDEETGSTFGAKKQINQGVRADFVIAGEGTDLRIVNQAKGIIHANISTMGKTAHGAHLWKGVSAIWRMKSILDKIEKDYPQPLKEGWFTTINIASISSPNKIFNKVPAECSMLLDVRYINEDKEKIIEYLKSFENNQHKVQIKGAGAVHFTSKNNTYIRILRNATKKILGEASPLAMHHGGSDIRHFNQVGCNGIEFGPIGGGHHSDSELVDVKSLLDYCRVLKDFLLTVR